MREVAIKNKYLLIIGVLVAVFWFAYQIISVLSPFLIAIVLAYLFNPLVNYFHAQGYKKGVIVAVLVTIGLLVVVEAIIFLVPKFISEVVEIRDRLPVLAKQVKYYLEKIQVSLQVLYPPLKDKSLPDIVMQQVYAFFESFLSQMPKIIGNLFNWLSLFTLIPFITIALLIDSDRLADWLFSIFPSRHTETVLSIISEINQVMRDFIQGESMRLFWLTVLTTIGLFALGVDFALLFGLLGGILNVIPVLGAWLGAIPPLLVVLLKGDLTLVVKLAVFFIAIQVLDNTFISTYYLSKSVKLHFVLVLFSLLAGAELYGLMGIILAVPAVSMLKVVIEILYRDYKNKVEISLRRGMHPVAEGE